MRRQKEIQPYTFVGLLFGGTIGATNAYNYKQSPSYVPGCMQSKIRLTVGIGLKSLIYGYYWPLSSYYILCSAFLYPKHQFMNHFIVFSFWGAKILPK